MNLPAPLPTCGTLTPIRGQTPEFRWMHEKDVYMADVSRNKQKLVKFDIVAESSVPPDKATTCAKLILDVLTSKVAPFVPIKMVYGLSDNIVYSPKFTDALFDYGIIIYWITSNLTNTMNKMGAQNDMILYGKTLPLNATDVKAYKKDPRQVGGLHCLVTLDLTQLLGTLGNYVVMHETMHCWSMWHEFNHPIKPWKWSTALSDQGKAIVQTPKLETVDFSSMADTSSMMLYDLPEIVYANNTSPIDPTIFTNEKSKLSDGDIAGVRSALLPLNGQPGSIQFERPFGGVVRIMDVPSTTTSPTSTTTTTAKTMSTARTMSTTTARTSSKQDNRFAANSDSAISSILRLFNDNQSDDLPSTSTPKISDTLQTNTIADETYAMWITIASALIIGVFIIWIHNRN